jgi:hypothetical protein
MCHDRSIFWIARYKMMINVIDIHNSSMENID